MKRNIVILGFIFSSVLFFTLGCGNKTDKSNNNDSKNNDFLEVFLDMKLNAEPGQYVFSPIKSEIDDELEANEEAKNLNLLYYHTTVDEVGDKTSKVEGEEVPNALIIPVPKDQKAEIGDVILCWSEGATELLRAVVVKFDESNNPQVAYFDSSFEDGQPDLETVEEDKILVLKDEWQQGQMIIYKNPDFDDLYEQYQIVNVKNGKIIAIGWGNVVNILDKKDCMSIKHADYKEGDSVQVPHIGSYTNGIILEIDDTFQRAKVEIEFAGDKESFYVPICDITTGLELAK